MKDALDTQAWYRQFWPWFLIVLPGSVVVAGLVTVGIAFKYSDSVVSDNYYKEGLAINRLVAQDQRARALSLAAELAVSGYGVQLQLEGDLATPPSALILEFKHPLVAARDFSLPLVRGSDRFYQGRLPAPVAGRWYLEIVDVSGEWRLRGELRPADEQRLRLQAEGADGR